MLPKLVAATPGYLPRCVGVHVDAWLTYKGSSGAAPSRRWGYRVNLQVQNRTIQPKARKLPFPHMHIALLGPPCPLTSRPAIFLHLCTVARSGLSKLGPSGGSTTSFSHGGMNQGGNGQPVTVNLAAPISAAGTARKSVFTGHLLHTFSPPLHFLSTICLPAIPQPTPLLSITAP